MSSMAANRRESLNLWLSVAGQGVSGLGHYLFSFAMGLYVLSLTGSAQSYAVTVAVSLMPAAILSPIVGVLADKLNKKALIVLSDTFSCVTLLAAFLLAAVRPLRVVDIYALNFLMSLFSPFVSVAFSSAAPRLVNAASLSKLTSYRSAVSSFIQVAAPLLGGAVYAVVEIETLILFSSIAYGLSAFSELFIDFNFNPIAAKEQAKESFSATLRGGAAYLFSTPVLVVMISFSLIINLLFSALEVVLPFSILEVLHLSESAYGIIMAGFSAGSLLGALIIGSRGIQLSRRLTSTCLVLFGVMLACIAACVILFAGNAAAVALTLVCLTLGLIASFINIAVNVFMQQVIPGDVLGRVIGLFHLASMLTPPVGMLVFGTLADYIAPQVLLTVCAVLIFGIALYSRRLTIIDEAVANLNKKAEENA